MSTVAPPTTPPPPTPPPDDAPDTCHAFFNIVSSARSEPFVCVPMDQCERGITCRLDILDTHYHINISLTTSSDVEFRVEDGLTDRLLVSTSVVQSTTTVSLPKPEGGSLVLNQMKLILANGVQPAVRFQVYTYCVSVITLICMFALVFYVCS